jgi:hypothetical protein
METAQTVFEGEQWRYGGYPEYQEKTTNLQLVVADQIDPKSNRSQSNRPQSNRPQIKSLYYYVTGIQIESSFSAVL